MYIILKPNVFLVKGAIKGCLYDFNTRNLYHLESHVVKMLENIVNQHENNIKGTEEKKLIKEFIENNLLDRAEILCEKSIKSLSIERKAPDFAWIEVTTKCNLYCIHCYDSASPLEVSVMNRDVFEKVCKFIKESSIKRIQLIGGEPLLLKETLREMICKIRKEVDFLEVFTNATLLTDFWASFFSEYDIHVAVSVYSYKDTEHDKVTTVRGSHLKTNKGIELLSRYNVPFRVCNVRMGGIEIGQPNTTLYTINRKKDIVRMAGRANFQLLSKDLIRQKIITESTFSVPLNQKISARLVQGHNCFGHKVYISSVGEVYPCVMERRWSYGNLVDNFENTFNAVNNSVIPIRKDEIKSCSQCEFRYTCFDCRPNSLGGNLDEKPWYCTYVPEKGCWENPDLFIKNLIKKYSNEG